MKTLLFGATIASLAFCMPVIIYQVGFFALNTRFEPINAATLFKAYGTWVVFAIVCGFIAATAEFFRK